VSFADSEPAFAFARVVGLWYSSLTPLVRHDSGHVSPAPGSVSQAADSVGHPSNPGRQASDIESEPSLGGHLLYAGTLDEPGRALIVAANIAGAASLAATADPAAQKQAIRDGIVDFLVNSLDEALRILKNEIRKRGTVAVCVALPPELVESEMRARGVAPDLVRKGAFGRLSSDPVSAGSSDREIVPASSDANQVLLAWRVGTASAVWLPKLDAMADACLTASDASAKRWLRLAPRYFGRLTAGAHVLPCDPARGDRFIGLAQAAIARAAIPVPVEIDLVSGNSHAHHRFEPPVA
jgi:urocanase-like protein